MSAPRLVATDLDGTLLRPDGTVSARTAAALAACESSGVGVVFVTARPPRWLAEVAEHVGGHGVAICANGAVVVDVATLRAVAASPVRGAVDWSGVHVWWGDERFVPADSPDRNELQAREALLDALPIPADNVHPIPAERPVLDEHTAAAVYAAELARHSTAAVPEATGQAPPAVPEFDVLLLGVGPDGHVASLFPGHATLRDESRTVVGEPDSPKPPPRRVSLTFPAIRTAREVWLVVAGEDKADAVARALSGAPVEEIPAAGALGTERTLWLVDVAAASKIPTP